jgi:DNA-binding HxlR family transcriptional regulator
LRDRTPALSEKMLTQRLRELERDGLVRKRKDGGRGARSSYELTARAQSLKPALTALNDWGMRMARESGAVVRPRW